MSNIDQVEYKKIHNGDLKTLLLIYQANKPIWKSKYFWFSLTISVICVLIIAITGYSFYFSIEFIGNNMLSIMPNILGFNLGGYVLLVGLNSQNILDEITEPIAPSKYSLFQKQSSVFAFSILIQATSILLGFVFTGIINLGQNIFLPQNLALTINIIGFWLISFVSIYSILLIGQIVINIFNFGQILHFFVRLERIEKENSEDNS